MKRSQNSKKGSVRSCVFKALVCILLFMISVSTSKDDTASNSMKLKKITRHYEKAKQQFHDNPLEGIVLPVVGQKNKSLEDIEYRRAEIQVLEKDTDAKLVGGYKQDLINDQYTSGSDDNSSVWIGVQYNLLKSGWYNRKHKIEKLHKQITLDSTRLVPKVFSVQCAILRRQMEITVEQQKGALRRSRQTFYEKYTLFSKNELLEATVSKTKMLYSLIEKRFERAALKADTFDGAPRIPLYEIDFTLIDTVFSDIQNGTQMTSMKSLESYSFLRSTSASVFLRGSHYPMYDADKNDLMAGIQFSIPLRYVNDEIAQHEKLQDQRKLNTIRNVHNEDRELFMLKAQKYNRYLIPAIESHYSLVEQEEKIESLMHIIEGKPNNSMKEVLELYVSLEKWFKVLEKNIDIRGELYDRLMITLAQSKSPKIVAVLKNVTFKESLTEILHAGNRSLYIHWKDFIDHSSDFLIQFAKVKNIKRFIISHPLKADRSQLQTFIHNAHEHGLSIELMYSTTEWINPKNHTKAIKRIIDGVSFGVDGIHLDVEPHILENWRDNSFQKVLDYIALIQNIRDNYSGYLSVSIPLIYPKEMYGKIFDSVDHAHLMVYGQTDVLKVIERTKRVLIQKHIEKSSLAIRCSDFLNELDLEQYIQEAYLGESILQFTLFDLGRYQKVLLR